MSRAKKFAPASAPDGTGDVGDGSKIGLFVTSIARHGNFGFAGCERIGGLSSGVPDGNAVSCKPESTLASCVVAASCEQATIANTLRNKVFRTKCFESKATPD